MRTKISAARKSARENEAMPLFFIAPRKRLNAVAREKVCRADIALRKRGLRCLISDAHADPLLRSKFG